MARIIDAEPVLDKLRDAMRDADGKARAQVAALIHLLEIQPQIQTKEGPPDG